MFGIPGTKILREERREELELAMKTLGGSAFEMILLELWSFGYRVSLATTSCQECYFRPYVSCCSAVVVSHRMHPSHPTLVAWAIRVSGHLVRGHEATVGGGVSATAVHDIISLQHQPIRRHHLTAIPSLRRAQPSNFWLRSDARGKPLLRAIAPLAPCTA